MKGKMSEYPEGCGINGMVYFDCPYSEPCRRKDNDVYCMHKELKTFPKIMFGRDFCSSVTYLGKCPLGDPETYVPARTNPEEA